MTHNLMVRARVAAHSGREVKTTGDGFLATFPSVGQALACAAAVQADLADYSDRQSETLSVRMGVHMGSVIRTDGDIHGWNVILASRIAELAGGGEVLVSTVARGLAGRTGRFRFGDACRVRLQGMAGEHLVHELLWRSAEPSEEAVASCGAR